MTHSNNGRPPLRVLQLVHYLEIGGLETLVIELSRHLRKTDTVVEVLSLHDVDTEYAIGLKKSGIPLHVILVGNNRFNISFLWKVATFVRMKRFDVLHSHSGCQLTAAIIAKLAGIHKLIYTAHGMPMFTRFQDRIEDSLASWLTSDIVSVSHEIDDFLRKWLLFPRCTFSTILNGVDTDKFKPFVDLSLKKRLQEQYKLPFDRVLFGSVGRLESVKNYQMILHAVKHLVDDGVKNIGCVFVGEGTERSKLDILTQQLDIVDYVFFLGMQYNIHQIVALWHFFILSSLTEGTSISLLESQACGIPAVVTDVGGNSFIISHGENGYLCSVNDVGQMAKYMKKYINDKESTLKMGDAGRKRVEQHFSLDVVTNNYMKIYQE